MSKSERTEVKRALLAEYRRIEQITGEPVRRAAWKDHADARLPVYATIVKRYGGWVNFQAEAGGGSVVQGHRYAHYMPAADPQWESLLDACRCIGQHTTYQAIVDLYVGIVVVAVEEAKGHISHWAGDVPNEDLSGIISSAKEFLVDQKLEHLLRSRA